MIINPIFTYAAYQPYGFYNYYCTKEVGAAANTGTTTPSYMPGTSSNEVNEKWCRQNFPQKCGEECLTVSITDFQRRTAMMSGSGSQRGLWTLVNRLGYSRIVTDADVSVDPAVLSHYKKVLLLHSEYVTVGEFNAIRNHPHVTYLYPDALHAQVAYNQKTSTITLIRGHNYNGTDYAFDWPYTNDKAAEDDRQCNNWQFVRVPNGKELNCYPESVLPYRSNMWDAIKLQ